MFDPVMLVTVNVTVPFLMDDVEVMVASPLASVTPLSPELLMDPVTLPVTGLELGARWHPAHRDALDVNQNGGRRLRCRADL